jgi:DNA-directed RNA polymerase subunit H (RpoH/RPB5)
MALHELLLKGVQNMVTKRGLGELSDIKSDIGHAYFIPGEILLFIPSISNGVIDKIKNEQVNHLFFLMETNEIQHAIVPYSAIAPLAAEILRSHDVYRVELFKYKHLLFDPTVHTKTPPHFRVSSVSEELPNIKVCDLPRILHIDPIVRFYDWKIGDVIRIERSDGVYYRVIVD